MPTEQYPSKLLEHAVSEFSKLPGIGRRTALRLVLFLLSRDNDALRKACTQLYHRTMTVYQEYQNRKDISGDFEVEGKIFLGYEYPALHPIQTETAKQVWDALTCGGFNALYDEELLRLIVIYIQLP